MIWYHQHWAARSGLPSCHKPCEVLRTSTWVKWCSSKDDREACPDRGRMIINTRTSRTLLFSDCSDASYISLSSGHIIVTSSGSSSPSSYTSSTSLYKVSLRDIFATLTRRINQHLSLCHQCILEHLFSIRHIIARIHRSVMQSAQSQSVHILKRSTFIRTCSAHCLLPLYCWCNPFAHLVTFPLAYRVEQQQFAVKTPSRWRNCYLTNLFSGIRWNAIDASCMAGHR